MTPKQTRLTLASVCVVAILWLAAYFAGSRIALPGGIEAASPLFDPARAMETTREFVTRSPRRVLGSLESRQSSGFIQQRLLRLGYQVGYAHFDARIGGPKEVGRNVFALKPGASDEIVALIAHYDTARTTVQGAMDNGSGVGVLLELARLFFDAPPRRGLLILATDGEEWGMLGARDFLETHPQRNRIVAALSLDYVAAGEIGRLAFECTGQFRGYTPSWLRGVARSAAAQEGFDAEEPGGFREIVERALPISWTDQGPFLGAGIPAINLGSRSRDTGLEFSIYHSERDTIENLRVESFGVFGRTAERILRALDVLPAIPDENPASIALSHDRALPSWCAGILLWISFLPPALAAFFHAFNHRRQCNSGRIQREVSALAGTMLPILLAYSIIRLLALLRKLPRYSLYPAPPKDPVLLNPPWGMLAGILATVLLVGALCWVVLHYMNRRLPRPDFFVSRLVLLAALMTVVLAALFYNPYWAFVFLLSPAWIWPLTGPGQGTGGRAANRLLILASGTTYVGVSWFYAGRLGIGWNFVWYEVLAVNTGLFSLTAFVLGSAACAIGLRFCVIQSFSRPE